MSGDDVLREAVKAHQAGRLAEAETGYRRVLQSQPHHPGAWYSLGLIQFHRGEIESAVRSLRRALEHPQASGRMWNTLGSMLMSADRAGEAREAYRRCTEVDRSMGEGWYNLAICLRKDGEYGTAVDCLSQAISCAQPFNTAYEALAMLLYELGRPRDAAEVSALWLARDPSSAKARHVAASMSGENVPQRASDEYVREHFDAAAAGFDDNLQRLDYRAPQLLAAEVRRIADGVTLPSVLDAGCGTGLCGPLVRPVAARLVGVDLSPRMIDLARRRDIYDELHVGELSAFLRARPNTFDAVISADTLVYFGALEEPFAAAREALRSMAAFAFTLEALPDPEAADYRLQFHGRYGHSRRYVQDALSRSGLSIDVMRRETLRTERSQPVAGFVIVARRS